MIPVAGTDRANWLDRSGIFSTDTPLANDAGIDMRRPRDPSAAKRQLAEAGYGSEPIVVIAPADVMHALSLVGADQLRRAGLKVDLQEMEFGAVVKWRTSQSPPDKGGWNVFFTLVDRSITNIHPFRNPNLRVDGKAAYDGWPDSPPIGRCGRTYHSSRWASPDRLPPTARASPGSSRVACVPGMLNSSEVKVLYPT
jgi:peptide/nickel transport system substrate-binding protein